ncbi:Importin subunit beta-1 [Pelomyxa schiedti]|nr:Importin subunit beta-1 [Pelomyxa schiedti]
MAAQDYTSLLTALIAADCHTRQVAESRLTALSRADRESYLLNLAASLEAADTPLQAKHLAALLIRNALTVPRSKGGDGGADAMDQEDDENDEEMWKKPREIWLQLSPAARSTIKDTLMRVLHTDAERHYHSTVAQAVNRIAQVELPFNEWPDLMSTLCSYYNNEAGPFQVNAVRLLGNICEDRPGLVSSSANAILTVVVNAAANTDASLRAVGMEALEHCIVLAKQAFGVPTEQQYIMHTILQQLRSPDPTQVFNSAFRCLTAVIVHYYDKLMPYMNTILEATVLLIRGTEEGAACQAIDLWTTIAEVETSILGGESEDFKQCQNFVAGALPLLVGALLHALPKAEDEAEAEADGCSKWQSSATCLAAVAACAGDAVVPAVAQFVGANLRSPRWDLREAAARAAGCVQEGPSSASLGPLIQGALPQLVALFGDGESFTVRQSAVWTAGRVVMHHHDAVQEGLPGLAGEVVRTLTSGASSDIGPALCYALQQILEPYRLTRTRPLAMPPPLFRTILGGVMAAAELPDAEQYGLPAHCYGTLLSLVRCCGPECRSFVPMIVDSVTAKKKLLQSQEDIDEDLIELLDEVMSELISPSASSAAATNTSPSSKPKYQKRKF